MTATAYWDLASYIVVLAVLGYIIYMLLEDDDEV